MIPDYAAGNCRALQTPAGGHYDKSNTQAVGTPDEAVLLPLVAPADVQRDQVGRGPLGAKDGAAGLFHALQQPLRWPSEKVRERPPANGVFVAAARARALDENCVLPGGAPVVVLLLDAGRHVACSLYPKVALEHAGVGALEGVRIFVCSKNTDSGLRNTQTGGLECN